MGSETFEVSKFEDQLGFSGDSVRSSWTLKWIKEQSPQVQRKFMELVTGIRSLTFIPITFTSLSDEETDGIPKFDSCYSTISLPIFESEDELSAAFGKLIN